jgi:hypothetical protein
MSQERSERGVGCDDLPEKCNNRAAVYSFSALENYAGYQKPNDLLDKLAKERTTDEPPKAIRFGTYRSEIKNPLAPAPEALPLDELTGERSL